MLKRYLLAGAAMTALSATPGAANKFVIDLQGVPPNRINVFVDESARDATPVGDALFGPDRIMELEMIMVYEAPDKPYWTAMDLQFKCPNGLNADVRKQYGLKKNDKWKFPEASEVEFRMVKGLNRLKNKDVIDDLQPTGWQKGSSFPILSAYRVACQSIEINHAQAASVKPDGMLDPKLLTSNLTPLGLGHAMLVPLGMAWWKTAEFTWDNLWNDVPKPTIMASRKLTPAEQAEYEKNQAALLARMESTKAMAMGIINEHQTRSGFDSAAAKLRGSRKVSKTERSLLYVWQGKTEHDVVAAMGPPAIQEAGGIRFLSYGQSYDNRVLVTRVFTSQQWVEGVYKQCDVRYVLIPDPNGVQRVADVNVSSFRDGSGAGPDVCANLLQVPRN